MRKEILSSDVPFDHCSNCCVNEYCFVTDPLSRASQNIAEIVMMGGSLARGNTNTSAEFNTYVDTHCTNCFSNQVSR